MTFNATDFLAGLFDDDAAAPAAPANSAHAGRSPRSARGTRRRSPISARPAGGPAVRTVRWADADDLQPERSTRNRTPALGGMTCRTRPRCPSCPTCPRVMTWQDGSGRWRCGTCDPPERSRRWAERAERRRLVAAVWAAAARADSIFRQNANGPAGRSPIARPAADCRPPGPRSPHHRGPGDNRALGADRPGCCPSCGPSRAGCVGPAGRRRPPIGSRMSNPANPIRRPRPVAKDSHHSLREIFHSTAMTLEQSREPTEETARERTIAKTRSRFPA